MDLLRFHDRVAGSSPALAIIPGKIVQLVEQ